ncbi:pantoate--beta-alanine ligase [Evansella vedderi]|uniref:Pantothenate synthetase n=1 Tax=Evansella vedderi TaxID=38282 RepID=A0ABU0A1T7_9BACI|nr:pantoate--beta-alanine ligase [Evansella vedderi]MDQ0257444.1 pantoate--beta-alanine ligase [Evansella vedderi]
MKKFTEIKELKEWIRELKLTGMSIGFVPTMGYLHEGHLSLVEQAKNENDLVILSIFVNPLQFGEGEDFDRYPKDKERDLSLASKVGVDAVFMPTVKEMYPKKMSATLVVHEGTDVLCGAKRPGHFDGVATVVMKLFGIVAPDRAYFGLKDAQQVAVIERLVNDYHLDIEIVRGATVREADGLAKSSRNVNLTSKERVEAPIIFRSLLKIKDRILNGTYKKVSDVEEGLKEELSQHITGYIDYAEVRSFPSLKELNFLQGELIIAVAVKYSKVRLIDNLIVNV